MGCACGPNPGATASATRATPGDKAASTRKALVRKVHPLGFEPRTCGLRVRCSAVELEAQRVRREAVQLRGTRVGWLRGLEPPTSWTTTRRSNQLSYSHQAAGHSGTTPRSARPAKPPDLRRGSTSGRTG